MKYLFFLLSIVLVFPAKAQQSDGKANGVISGIVNDSVAGTPVQYATIALVDKQTGNIVNGATADEKGVFKITGITYGIYKARVSFLGYKTKTIDNLIINKAAPAIALGIVKLAAAQTTLANVTITADKSIIQNQIDKTVYNVEQDVTSQSGSASDVLKKVPEVSVDVDGNVELQGNSSIRFLIDGKPSVVFGNNIAEVLQAIPASEIKSIEVITSPGAKYDAEGTGGIINIILKKSTAEGFNGNVSLTGGTRFENGSINLNAHHKHFGANAFVSGNAQLPSTTTTSLDRVSQNVDPAQTTELTQSGPTRFNNQGFQSGIGFDWDATTRDNFNGSFGFNYYGNNYNGYSNRTSIVKDSAGNQLSDVNDVLGLGNRYQSQSFNWGLGYKKKFNRDGQQLVLNYSYSGSHNTLYYQQTQTYVVPDSLYAGSYGNNPGFQSETNLSADYDQPLGKKGATLETGVKTVLDNINSTSDVYSLTNVPNDYDYNASQSSTLTYKRSIYAGYVSVKDRLLNWLDFQVGLRNEYTQTNGFTSNSTSVLIKPYDTWVPSAMISHKFKNDQTLKLSYTHRIQRPQYSDLNPFVNATDPKNLVTGNTQLLPEVGDKIEMGYSKSFDKGTYFSTTLFYRGNKDDIQSYTSYYSSYTVGDSVYNNVAVTTRQNVGREDNFGLSLFASVPVADKLNFRSYVSLFQRYITNGDLPGQNTQGFNYRVNLNGSYEISKTFVVEAFGNFNSPRVNVQGTMPAFFSYNFAIRKQFYNKKASLALTATNPFGEYVRQATELTGANFTLNSVRELPYRSFGINFTYKFGKLEFKKVKEKENEEEDTNGPQG